MSRSIHYKEKYQINSELSLVHCNEGTSARTRPFSFQDIMLRRKNKKAAEIQAAPGDSDTRERNIENAADSLETDGDRHHQSIRGGSRPVSEDSGRVSSRRQEHNTHGVHEGKLVKDRSRERRDLETKSNSTLTKNPSYNDSTAGKSDRQNKKRSNRSNEDSRDESNQRHLRDRSRKETGEKTNGKSLNEREHKQGTDNDHKQVYSRRRDVEQSGHDYENEPNKRHLRAWTGIDKYADAGRGKSERESRSKRQGEGKEKIRDQDVVKKHHMHKSKNSEILERKEKEPSTVHYEELISKRKRSGSKEHDKDRIRRSSSVSPRAHKRTSIGDQSYSSKDKFQRSHADGERKRISSNGSNSNQRRYSGSSSGLGGYSPRKRKTEAAAKTPSPATRSPEHRAAGWDHPATRKEWDINSSVVSHVQSSIQTAPENGPQPSI